MAMRVQHALKRFPAEVRKHVPVLLTAHSMPKRVVEKEPDYISSLKETAAAVADHLEILYDIEIGAREQAEAAGIVFARTESLNTSPLFIKALAAVVMETLGTMGA